MPDRTVPSGDVRDRSRFLDSSGMSILSAPAVTSSSRPSPKDPELLLCLGGFVFALVIGLLSGEEPVRAWAPFAALGTGTGAALLLLSRVVSELHTLRTRLPWAVPAMVASLVTLVPLGFAASTGIEVVEVGILEDGAGRWLETGSPYPDAEALASATEAADYNVYFPLLVLSGLPAALFGESAVTDARWFLLLGSVLVLWFTTRSARTVLLFCALPPAGMVTAAGMTDLLPIVLVCAALVFVTRTRAIGSGVLAGLAAGAKLLAWPAVPVLFIAYAFRGMPAMARRYCGAVVGTLLVVLALPAVVDAEAFWRNTILLPLAFEPVTLVARTPLPGYLLSSSGELGRTIALLLLMIAALGMLAWLLVRPPGDVRAMAGRLAVGWTLLFSLAPATRIGYFVFPMLVLAWVLLQQDRIDASRLVPDRTDAAGTRTSTAGSGGRERVPGLP